MRIALDGCDGVGKSTIAEKLANKFGCNIVRLTNGGDRSMDSYMRLMNCENIVHDRTFMSEVVYPKYFKKNCHLSERELNALYYFIQMIGINVFILTASNETLAERLYERGDEFLDDIGAIPSINNDYLEIAKEHEFKIIDTTNKTIDEIVEEIGGYIENVC